MLKTASTMAMTRFLPWYLVHILIGSLTLVAMHLLYRFTTKRTARRTLIQRFGCKPPVKYPQKDPFFGLDILWDIILAIRSKTYLDLIRRIYQQNGNTFTSGTLASAIIHTIEPENLKCVLSTNFKDYEIGAVRKNAFSPLLKRGILVSDGLQWEHSRNLLRPSFTRTQISDLTMLESHVKNLIKAIPRDRSTVDLSKLFSQFTADITTDFLFGESIQTLTNPRSLPNHFLQAFEDVQIGIEERARRGKLADFLPQSKLRESVKQVYDFIDEHVEKAIEYHRSQRTQTQIIENPGKMKERYILLRELGKLTDDKELLRADLLTIFFAGRDTTASLLSNVIFVLARRPDIWRQIRSEVNELKGAKPTLEQMNRMSYIRYCLNESLRLHPPLPHNSRVASTDTVLPTGGGSNGLSPVFVPAGTEVAFDPSALHRREDLWGNDADEFRPERWTSEKTSWKFLPFSGGPRICIGQQFALTEASYALIRLAQEFQGIESRDSNPWTENVGVVCTLANGAKVSMVPA